ncbi:hypothetical protein DFJ63DRAFT_114982 [Scheffersomyces coipomensis]|uniref:uncharacterized protein n=1 Tax=Scheffersomyces coipomensis TaxID=1788519 RepID=UPI00315C70EC
MAISIIGKLNGVSRIAVRLFSVASSRFNQIQTFKVAVVGTGPGGFYTAHHLLNKSSPDIRFELDFFERLPAPHGLSRYGVAPDHPEVKNCEEYLDNIFSSTKSNHKVRFFGNVDIGKDISLNDLQSHYNSIVLSYGCTSSDNELNIPGSKLPGVLPARQFVNWYNGHPDYYEKDNLFVPPPLDKITDVTIIGNGNVALDVARVLLADPEKHWASTDISEDALKILKTSTVKNVNIVGRRGLLESAFSNKEIRELFELSKEQSLKFTPLDESYFKSIDVSKLGRVDKRKVSIIEKYSKVSETASDDVDRTWSLQYLKSPVEFITNPDNPNLLSSTKIVMNELVIDDLTKSVKVKPTTETEVIKNELVILSIGYKGSGIQGFEDIGILYENGKLFNKDGRILSSESKGKDDHSVIYKKGWYTSGWIKNGPKGVIATTMMDSFDTADRILTDLSNGVYLEANSDNDITNLLKDKRIVTWGDWKKLDNYELSTGQQMGKSRFKLCNREEMFEKI